ncbi:MAG: hypothetical protein EOO27_19055 [Comamonadaceae bacterium]|nr:MAG: hypothetical protein EOO27_19055 [Comamonadaceae bacterium]
MSQQLDGAAGVQHQEDHPDDLQLVKEQQERDQWQAVRLDWRNPRAVLAQYRQAITDAEGYLVRGDHTSYSRRIYRGGRTYTQWLADRINEL